MAWDEEEETVELEGVRAKVETDRALLCVIDGDEHWIPKSAIRDDSEVYEKGHEGRLVIAGWLAKDRGLA